MKPTNTEKLEYSSDIRKILHPTIPKAYLISIAATMLISAS